MRLITTLALPTALTLALISLSGCNKDAHSEEKKAEAVIPVEAKVVLLGDIAAAYAGTATLTAENEAWVSAKASGIVTRVLVEEGDIVKAGQTLAQLDTEKLALEAERHRTQLAKLENELARSSKLIAKNLISADAHEKLKFEVATLKAAYQMAALEVKNATVVAPIDGIIAERLIKTGNMVALNQATFRISDFDPLHAVLHVPEQELAKLKVEQTAQVQADALRDKRFTGTIKRISPVVDPASGTFKVTVEVRDPAAQLKPGMFGRVSVVYDLHKAARLLPKDAVLAEDKSSAVFIVRDGIAYRQRVTTGFSNDQHIEITDGLKAGDLVVTAGHANLKDKTKVELLKL